MSDIFGTLYQHYESMMKNVKYVDYQETSLKMGETDNQKQHQDHIVEANYCSKNS